MGRSLVVPVALGLFAASCNALIGLDGPAGEGSGGASSSSSAASSSMSTGSSHAPASSSSASSASTGGGGRGGAGSSASATMSASSASSAGGGGGQADRGAPGQVFCGLKQTLCDLGQICCYDENGYNDVCSDPAACSAMAGYIVVTCDGPEDCPGEICCATYDAAEQTYTDISCADVCASQTLCDPAASMPCPNGQVCKSTQYLDPGYSACQ